MKGALHDRASDKGMTECISKVGGATLLYSVLPFFVISCTPFRDKNVHINKRDAGLMSSRFFTLSVSVAAVALSLSCVSLSSADAWAQAKDEGPLVINPYPGGKPPAQDELRSASKVQEPRKDWNKRPHASARSQWPILPDLYESTEPEPAKVLKADPAPVAPKPAPAAAPDTTKKRKSDVRWVLNNDTGVDFSRIQGKLSQETIASPEPQPQPQVLSRPAPVKAEPEASNALTQKSSVPVVRAAEREPEPILKQRSAPDEELRFPYALRPRTQKAPVSTPDKPGVVPIQEKNVPSYAEVSDQVEEEMIQGAPEEVTFIDVRQEAQPVDLAPSYAKPELEPEADIPVPEEPAAAAVPTEEGEPEADRYALSRADFARQYAQEREWKALADFDLRDVLYTWSQRAGVALVWDSEAGYMTEEPMRFEGTYQHAVEQLLSQYEERKHKPSAQIYVDGETGQRYLVIRDS